MKKNERTKCLLTMGCIMVSISMLMALTACPEEPGPGNKLPKGSFSITKLAAQNGSFTVSATSAKFEDEIYLKPTPADVNSEFTEWTITPDYVEIFGPDADGEYMFIMPEENVTIGAVFSRFFTVTAAEGITGGNIVINPAKAAPGATFQVTVNPDPGMELDEISSTPFLANEQQGTSNRYTFTMGNANVTINATFKLREYTITKGTVTGGDLAFSASTAVAGTEITITVTINPNHNFIGFITTPPALAIVNDKFIMPASNVTIGARFQPEATAKLPTPTTSGPTGTSTVFYRYNTNGSIELDRGSGATRLMLGGEGETEKNTFDGLDGVGATVAEARIYCYDSLANANTASGTDPGTAIGYFLFKGVKWTSADGSAEWDLINDSTTGGGIANWPGNWYIQAADIPAMLERLVGATGQVWIRAQFIAAGSNRAFDSDLGAVSNPQ